MELLDQFQTWYERQSRTNKLGFVVTALAYGTAALSMEAGHPVQGTILAAIGTGGLIRLMSGQQG